LPHTNYAGIFEKGNSTPHKNYAGIFEKCTTNQNNYSSGIITPHPHKKYP
jgi:hypothetical protein